MLQSNWRGEYRSFTDFLNQSRIIFRHSCPYTHHQNGLVERKHKHIVKIRLTLLAHYKLPFKFWWDAFHTIVYLINRLASFVLNLSTPFEKVFNQNPNYNMLKSFGCACYSYLRDYNKHKFDYHSNKCLFLDYSTSHNGYKCLHPSRKLYIARHVIFYEHTFLYSTDSVFHKLIEYVPSLSCSYSPQQIYTLSTLPAIHTFTNNNNDHLNSASPDSSGSTPSVHPE